MRIHCQVALALCVSVVFAACAPQPPAPPATPQVDVDAERAAITALGDEYVRLFGNQDAAGVAGLYTMEAVRVVAGQAPNRGNDAIAAAIQTGFDNGNQSLAVQTDEMIVAENGRTAVSYGTYELDVTPPDGEPMTASGNFMNALTKEANGAWKISRSLVARVSPAPAPGGN